MDLDWNTEYQVLYVFANVDAFALQGCFAHVGCSATRANGSRNYGTQRQQEHSRFCRPLLK